MIGHVEVKQECLGFVTNLQMFLTEIYVLAILSVFASVDRKHDPFGNIFSYLK